MKPLIKARATKATTPTGDEPSAAADQTAGKQRAREQQQILNSYKGTAGGLKMARVKYLSVSDGKRLHIEAYPNFHKSGSIKGMKEKYYGKDALLVRCGSYIYKVDLRIYLKAH